MRSRSQIKKLVFFFMALVALVALTQAAVLDARVRLNKRAITMVNRINPAYRGDFLNWDDVQQGHFRRNADFRPLDTASVMNMYADTYFYGRMPLIRFHGEQFASKVELQQLYATFGNFYAQKVGTENIIEVGDGFANEVVDQNVRNFAHNLEQTQQKWGRTVAKIAFGYRVQPLVARPRTGLKKVFGKTKLPSAPTWESIAQTQPTLLNGQWSDFRERLAAQRFLKFHSSDGRTGLLLRALPGGEVQHQFIDLSRNGVIFQNFAHVLH